MAEFWGYTPKLYFDDGTGALLVGAVKDIEGPGMNRETVDVASRDAGQLTKRISGMAAAGNITFEIVYDPDLATQNVLSAALTAGTMGTMYLVIDDLPETGWYGRAMVESFKPKAPLEDAFVADVSIVMARAANELNYLTDATTDYMVMAAGATYWIV